MQQSVLTDTETRVFWIVAANRAGKSQLASRIVSWFFDDCHPYFKRPPEWGTGPLQILVVGRVGEQLTSELWERKIAPFIQDPHKPVKIGNELKRVENLRNGNRIIFLSHHDAVRAREKVQAYTAHVVLLDEMPDDAGLVTELMMRTITTNGRMYAAFTPLLRNEDIRRIVETPRASTRHIKLQMLDNPVFKGREAEIESEVRAMCTSDSEFKARMFGEWFAGATRVFAYDAARNRHPLPADYDPVQWRHVAICDPAASGLAGLLIAAQDPSRGHWYLVAAEHLQGASAYELFDRVEARLAPYRVTHRICDCNPAGFYKEARRRRAAGESHVDWSPMNEKQDRKLDSIDKVNVWFQFDRVRLTTRVPLLEEDLVKAEWADRSSAKIVAASSYHLADCLRYFVWRAPAEEVAPGPPLEPSAELRREWARVRERRAQAQQARVARVLHAHRSHWQKTAKPRVITLR